MSFRIVFWVVFAGLAAVAVLSGVESARYRAKLERWWTTASAEVVMDLSVRVATVEWAQDCASAHGLGLFLRPSPPGGEELLAGLRGSGSVQDIDGEFLEQVSWGVTLEVFPAETDGWVRVASITPPPNGDTVLHLSLDPDAPIDLAGSVEFELRPELCGLESLPLLFTQTLTWGAGILAGLLGLVVVLTRRPPPR